MTPDVYVRRAGFDVDVLLEWSEPGAPWRHKGEPAYTVAIRGAETVAVVKLCLELPVICSSSCERSAKRWPWPRWS